MNKYAAVGSFNRKGMEIIRQLSILSEDVQDLTVNDLSQEAVDKIASHAEHLDTLLEGYKANLLEIIKEASTGESDTITGISDGNGVRI